MDEVISFRDGEARSSVAPIEERTAGALKRPSSSTGSASSLLVLPERLGEFLLVGMQLILVLIIVHNCDIAKSNHFFPILCLAVGGFLVHACLPAQRRAAFFSLLSLSGIVFFLGWANGAYVIGIGAGLIALCYLPVRFGLRVALVGLAGVALVSMRLRLAEPFWPVLGSMFMFRMIIYLHELRHETKRPPLALTLAYFYPLPNICFLFFPILDFKTFRENYRPDAAVETAQTGIGFIVRGLLHVLLYRIIKYHLMPQPNELNDVPHLALFLASNYALYLHVSGYFHMITGILHLFGFQLPRTHHNYFLASSFTDIWRRINIPWKDFLMKLFFMPAFYALRGWGTAVAMAAAAMGVFLATWALHAYQVFWITGNLPLRLWDAALWLVVGVAVALNLQLDLAFSSRAAQRTMTWRRALLLSLRVAGMFVLICGFWTCWNTPKALVFFKIQLGAGRSALIGLAQVLGVLVEVVLVGTLILLERERWRGRSLLPKKALPAARSVGLTTALVILALIGSPSIAALFPAGAAHVIAGMRGETLSTVEAFMTVQGYYEEIVDTRVPTGEMFAGLEGQPPTHSSLDYNTIVNREGDMRFLELLPNLSVDVNGAPLTTNRFGMRDRHDRQQKKPANTYRTGLIGTSVIMGWGVDDNETFASLLEDRFNSLPHGEAQPSETSKASLDSLPAISPRHCEFLNFGVGKNYVFERRLIVDKKVFAFEPDAIFYVAHQDEFQSTATSPAQQVLGMLDQGRELPFPFLNDVVRQAGITRDTSPEMRQALLLGKNKEIVLAMYRDLVSACRRRGVLPVWVYLPIPGVTKVSASTFMPTAEEAGFVVINLEDWDGQRRPGEVMVAEGDFHPNVLGHQLIAERLFQEISRRPELHPATGPSKP